MNKIKEKVKERLHKREAIDKFSIIANPTTSGHQDSEIQFLKELLNLIEQEEVATVEVKTNS